ncbi:MAG: hypothetical protein WA103_00055 [Minisyncoccales bacterium]
MQTENVFVRLLTAVCAAAFLGVLPALPAQAAFPQDQAGIAAYVKLTGVSQTTFDTALDDFFDSTEPSGDTYMIGVKGYLVDDQPYDPYAYNKIDVHFYLGVDGWLAAYLLKDDPAAKIVNWRPGAELKDTLLEIALEDAIAKLGAAPTGEIKYHDFSAPASSKMTLVKESSPANDQDVQGNPINHNEFSAMMKGTLNRFSWSVEGVGTSCGGHSWTTPVDLFIEGSGSIAGAGCSRFTYGDYIPAPEIFNDQKSHIVRMSKNQGDKGANGVFVFIYGN